MQQQRCVIITAHHPFLNHSPSPPQPATVQHWLTVITKRVMLARRLKLPVQLDQDILAILLLFSESMHKVRERF